MNKPNRFMVLPDGTNAPLAGCQIIEKTDSAPGWTENVLWTFTGDEPDGWDALDRVMLMARERLTESDPEYDGDLAALQTVKRALDVEIELPEEP